MTAALCVSLLPRNDVEAGSLGGMGRYDAG
jgi:hypothetical protein